jgi:CHAT domain-containing protein/tetratricopeptide (TPR) repeat protein
VRPGSLLVVFVCVLAVSAGVPVVAAQTANQEIARSNRDLDKARAAHDRSAEARAMRSLANGYNAIGQPQRALELLTPALNLSREIKDRGGEATTLTAIGETYWALGSSQKAIDFYTQALPIEHEVGDRAGEAVVLSDIGDFYADTGKPDKAVEFLNQALTLERATEDRSDEAVTLNNIATVFADTGKPEKALQFYRQALNLQHALPHRSGEAITLHAIGVLYASMGQPQKALQFYQQAISLERQTGDRGAEGNTLAEIGGAHLVLHHLDKALALYTEALQIQRSTGDRRRQAMTLNNIGAVYFFMGQPRRARAFYNLALPLENEAGDQVTKAYTLWGLALVEGDAALPTYLAALSIARSANAPDLQGSVDSSLMNYFRLRDRVGMAIFFGKQAVNSYQQIRSNIGGADTEMATAFVQSKSDSYRQLADLLAEQNRLGEAEQVLDLLKEQELKETVRGGMPAKDSSTSILPASESDSNAATELETQEPIAQNMVALVEERDGLQAKAKRTDAEQSRLEQLNDQVAAANGSIRRFFDVTLFAELGATESANAEVSHYAEESSSIRSELSHLPPRTVAVYTLVTDQHAYLIVITPTLRIKREARLSGQQLREAVLAVREELRTANSHPQRKLQDLYEALILPILPDLQAANAQTILWSLDGVLRYLPMNGLYDGKHYLVEDYDNVVITPASRNHLLETAKPADWPLLAMGLSKSYLGQEALQGVDVELNAIVRDPQVPASHGLSPGRLLENDAFTLAAFQELSAKFPVVHIASHFVFDPGHVPEPYLLLGGDTTGGNGYRLTTSEMSDRVEFTGVQLLTLSACSTALADKMPNGREMDSLGMIAQKNDAAAVMSTLWDVNDASTSVLMSDFYSRWLGAKPVGKGEALRQAQLDLLHRTGNATGSAARGFQLQDQDASAPSRYAHPYYWAPFVLVGNFQ